MADIEASVSKDGATERITPVLNEKRQWYRTTLFNACVIGGVGFLAPGLWNAMNSLGTHLLLQNFQTVAFAFCSESVNLIRTRNRCWRSRVAILDQRRQCLGVRPNGLLLLIRRPNRE